MADATQVEGIIHFDNDEDEIVQWDHQIQNICVTVNDIMVRWPPR
jgi:hypothetical protein